jgi:Zn-dependent alcohol dehydrogenase
VIEPIDVPEPADDGVLVRIVGVGICATDLASRDGLLGAPLPSGFGHEGADIVERVGPTHRLQQFPQARSWPGQVQRHYASSV